MDKPSFVYTTFIKTTPERLWQGLTDPSFTMRYWNIAFETDWKTGSPMTWKQGGIEVVDGEHQRVLEADPYSRLSYTWHTFTPEWAKAVGVNEETRAALLAEPRSKVTFEIEPAGETVKLTVVHEGGETLLGMSRHGWPQLLSGLKTLLETGEPLPAPTSG
jgi:uncharacterized protein YndB with AHSA1/START domain